MRKKNKLLLLALLIVHGFAYAQNDKVLHELLRPLSFGCEFQKKDSLQEFAFSINVFVNIKAGKVDSFTTTGNLPPNCNLSRPEYLARENKFLVKYLSGKKIDWKTWVASYGYKGCNNVILVFPQILGTYDIKRDLGSTYYKDFVVPFYETEMAQSQCTMVFKPSVGRSLYKVF